MKITTKRGRGGGHLIQQENRPSGEWEDLQPVEIKLKVPAYRRILVIADLDHVVALLQQPAAEGQGHEGTVRNRSETGECCLVEIHAEGVVGAAVSLADDARGL